MFSMYVVKRDGRKENVMFDKIQSRIKKLCYGLDEQYVDPALVAQKVCMGVYKGVTTVELDELAAETAAHMTSVHPDYGLLAARISVSNLHKETKKSWLELCDDLYNYVEPRSGQAAPLLSDATYKVIRENADRLNSAIVYDRDYNYDYFGFKTLERSYLLKLHGKVAERPQHMLMRVSVGIHGEDIDSAIETYNLLSQKWFTHASPTLFNAGTPNPQLSSCFLLTMDGDSIEGIYDTLKNCAMISKQAGGIGLSVHNIRAQGSYIRGTNGTSNGLVPMLRCFNATARYVDQGGGKRKGAFAIYLEPWHADVFEFLDLRKNHGSEEHRARDLFYALWVPDLFMKRVEADGVWSLMCPNQSPGLHDVHSEEFEELYERYENTGKFVRQIKARELWTKIVDAQTETGNPYMLFKDACNRKSNQQNLGTIRSSNLCTEIIEFSSPDEIAVCNLASIALNMFVSKNPETGETFFDFQKLYDVTRTATRNLNKIIDVNYYPVPQARNSNMRHRPIGLGVQGLADAFILMRFPFGSPEAAQLNRDIFETIYFAACTASCELAEVEGPYSSFEGSPMSQGKFQFDLWNVKPTSGRWDWDSLRQRIMKRGIRNSLLVAPMPTASTSQILGNNEAIEPYTSNMYVRRTLAGEFMVVNRHLLKDLIERGLWDEELKNQLIANNGSVQSLARVPQDLKELYKTVWEIPGKTIIDMAAARGAFIDQSQSLNMHLVNVNLGKLTSMHFYAWKAGLKTGMYYLRTKAAVDPIKFTVDQQMLAASELKQKQLDLAAAAKSQSKSAGSQEKGVEQQKLKVAEMLNRAGVPVSSPSSSSSSSASPSALQSPAASEEEKQEPVNQQQSLSDGASQDGEEAEGEEDRGLAAWRAERQRQREAMMCSLNNKDDCVSCGS